MIYLLRIAVLFLSFAGYISAYSRRFGISRYFAPAAVFSLVSLCLYGAGLLGVLPQAAWAVYVGGLFFLVRGIVKKQFAAPKVTLISAGIAVTFAVLLIMSLGMNFRHYDNFSHWAVAAKHMLHTGGLPGADADIVTFRYYPPGSTLFIYYVCRFTGRSDGMMLLGINMLILSCFYAMFGVVKSEKRFLLYSVLAAGSALLTYVNITIRTNNLLVDLLLPVLALSAIAGAYRYRGEPGRLFASVSGILGFTGIVKSTGAAFAVIALIYSIWAAVSRREERTKKALALCAALILAAATPFLLWKLHVAADLAGVEDKFALAACTAELASVSENEYPRIIRLFLKEMTDPGKRGVHFFLGVNLAAAAGCVCARCVWKKRWRLGKILLLMDGVVLLYHAGMLGMYLFAMPAAEAVRLAGFERYACSVMVLFGGVMTLCLVSDLEKSLIPLGEGQDTYRAYTSPAQKRRYQTAVLLSAMIAVNFLYSEFNGLAEIQRSYSQSLAGRISALCGDRWRSDGTVDEQRYLVVRDDSEDVLSTHETRYTARYFLYAPNVDVAERLDRTNIDRALLEYDHIVVLDESGVSPEIGGRLYETLGKSGVYSVSGVISQLIRDSSFEKWSETKRNLRSRSAAGRGFAAPIKNLGII